ncbi:hypothetical protein AVEN_208343-1 [Araneus ventricosus]|uniref:Mutator-like transposase domain-containing protein n=1 Tax=Araneus ventricosus TaxID=182803 RepID=A0A4Y2FHU9_ARAVE|nr:hypothetical protein AVEN_208343-1 [Araneus ventricosus]
MDTGKVLDIDVLSKYCAFENKKNHEKSAKSNFRGSRGMMEVKGACNIFKRSLTFHNARYTKYLGDGVSKVFDAIIEENIYGDEFQVEKLACIGHVMKRMGPRLRRLKEKMKGQLLSDSKRFSGKNRLTDSQIDKIQNYYDLAIRRNLNSVHAMRQAVRAIFMHKLSTDENPQHGFCPIGEDSSCGFKRAEATGSAYKHKNNLPVAVVEAMRPVHKDLSHPGLLKKCVHGNMRNPNESVNNVIWSRVHKSTFVQIEALSPYVYDAVCTFNEGNSAKLQILTNLGIQPGEYTFHVLKCLDKEKLLRAKYGFSQQSKENGITEKEKKIRIKIMHRLLAMEQGCFDKKHFWLNGHHRNSPCIKFKPQAIGEANCSVFASCVRIKAAVGKVSSLANEFGHGRNRD